MTDSFPAYSAPNISSPEHFIQQLSKDQNVEGVFVLGTPFDSLRPESDLDIGIVLAELPVPVHVGLTHVGERLTDMLFVTADEVAGVPGGTSPAPEVSAGSLAARLLAEGTLEFDRSGSMAELVASLDGTEILEPDKSPYAAWFKINYDLRHNRRMLNSDNSVYASALELRLLYSLFEAVLHYFHLRELAWRGEKRAVEHLQAKDGDYYRVLSQALRASEISEVFRHYEELARLATEPVGGLAPPDQTIFQYRGGTRLSAPLVENTEAFWSSLISGET